MITVDATASLDLPREFTDDELADLIAAVIDSLDDHVIDPDVGTTREGDAVRVRVSMTVDTQSLWIAQARALHALQTAFDTAVPEIAGKTSALVFSTA